MALPINFNVYVNFDVLLCDDDDLRVIINQVRCLADSVGIEGILGKRNQKTKVVLKRGVMKIGFHTRAKAKEFQSLVARFWSHVTETRRTRVKKL